MQDSQYGSLQQEQRDQPVRLVKGSHNYDESAYIEARPHQHLSDQYPFIVPSDQQKWEEDNYNDNDNHNGIGKMPCQPHMMTVTGRINSRVCR